MRASLVFVALVIALAPVPGAHAEDPPQPFQVSKDGYRIKLEDGLALASGGELLITRRDLEDGFGVDVRRLIPRITPRSKRARKQPRTWLLCYGDACVRYKGPVEGADGYESFPLSKIARAFRWKVQREGPIVEIAEGGGGKDRRSGKLGDRIPDLTLPGLDGTPRSLRALRGKRVLIVLWASWSQSRETLSQWAVEWKTRASKGLELWAAAVDIEGADRARSYVPPEIADRVVLDRDGVLASIFGARDENRFALIDDLGLVRAVGENPDTVDLAWIDAHLLETPREATEEERRTPASPSLAELREAAAKNAKRVEAHVALARALEASDPAAAIASLRTAYERKPKSGVAVHLARVLLDTGNLPGAMKVLDEARRQNPGAMWLRRQYWALEQPDRFYSGPIDTKWQAEQKKQEDLEWGRLRKANKKPKKDR
ncbi:MAG: tetratricopeptide repeat protein [Planctomycetota bacterium]|nr:tetratricopeptide repeat protein [Planctomycetota bacterium]